MLCQNKKHEVYIINNHTIALNTDDDKRLMQTNTITKLVIGYPA